MCCAGQARRGSDIAVARRRLANGDIAQVWRGTARRVAMARAGLHISAPHVWHPSELEELSRAVEHRTMPQVWRQPKHNGYAAGRASPAVLAGDPTLLRKPK